MSARSGAFSRFRIILGLVIAICVSALIGVGCGGGGSSVSSSNMLNTLSGRVLDDSAPASVRAAGPLTGVAGAQVWIEDLAADAQFHTVSGANGEYSFHGVPEGPHRVVAKFTDASGVKKTRSYAVVVPIGAETTVAETLILERAKNYVTGILRDTNGTFLPFGTVLRLWGEAFTVGRNGSFTSPPLPDGVYEEVILVQTGQAGRVAVITAPFVSAVMPAFMDLRIDMTGTAANHPPSGTLIARNATGIASSTGVSGTLSVTVNGYDPDAGESDHLLYQWSTTLGTLEAGSTLKEKTFRAPNHTGVATISVIVTDPRGATGTIKLPLLVGINSPSEADLTPPTSALAALVNESFDNTPFQVRITFSEVVTGFDAADLKLTNGTVTELESVTAGTVFLATIKPTAIGNVSIELPAGIAADLGGNLNSAATAVTITNEWSDAVPPADPTINPVTALTNVTPQVIGGTKPADAVLVLVNGSSVGVTYPTQTTWEYSLALQQGANPIRVTCRDAAENESNAVSASIEYDGIAPSAPTAVTLTPIGGTVVANTLNGTNTSLQVSATIVAGQATGGKSELLLNGASFSPAMEDTTIAAGDTTLTFDFNLGGTAAVQSKFTAGGVVSVRLRDSAGSSVDSSAGNPTLVVDYAIPIVSAPTNTAQTLKNGATSTSKVQSNEAGDIYLVKNGVAAGTPAQIANAVTANQAFAGKTGAVANTAYTVTLPLTLVEGVYDIVAVDTAGNVSAILPGWLTVDNTVPVVSAPTSGAQTLRSGVLSTSTVQSNEAGSIYLILRGQSATTLAEITTAISSNRAFAGKLNANANTAYKVTPADGLVDGIYDLVAVDIAGNVSQVVAGWLTIDNTKPVATAPISVAQTLRSGVTSTSTVRSNEAGKIYLVLHGEAATTQTEIDTAVTANKAFLGKDGVLANEETTVTPAAGLVDGLYDIVAVDAVGNVSTVLGGWLTIDNTAPTVLAVNSATPGSGFVIGNTIDITMQFSENVRVVTTGGTPALTMETGATDRAAPWQSGDAVDTIVFRYTVQSGDFSADLDYANTTALALNGGTIKDEVGNAAVLTLPAPGAAGSLGANRQMAVNGVVTYAFGGHLGGATANWWNGVRLSGTFHGMAVNSSGDMYISDYTNNRIYKLSSAGAVTAVWGSFGTGDKQFKGPRGVALDSGGNVFVVDSGNNRIQKFNSSGDYLGQFGSTGGANGKFSTPTGITIDSLNNIYVTDADRVQKFTSAFAFSLSFKPNSTKGVCVDGSGNIYVVSGDSIKKYDSTGVAVGVPWGSSGSGDGQFSSPEGIAVASSGNILVADAGHDRIQEFTTAGVFVSKFGTNGTNDGQFKTPKGVAVDSSGNVYVVDTNNYRIQKFTSLFAFNAKWGTAGTAVGQFKTPYGVARDSSGNLYVADTANNRIQKFSSSGAFVTAWGTAGSGDGEFSGPKGIAVDASDNIYVVDSGNVRVQKFTSAGVFVTKWAAQNGSFNNPSGIAVSPSGNVYVADTGNHRILKYDSSGAIVSTWGTSGSATGQFESPEGVAVDWAGNIYVADTANHRIQKFDSSNTFTLTWGSSGATDGTFASPKGIAVDAAGNVYVSDTGNNRVQKFSPTGSFMAKWNAAGSGDSQFLAPVGIVVDSSGFVYVIDSNNHTLEKFTH